MPTMVAPSQKDIVVEAISSPAVPIVPVQKPDEAHYAALIKVETDASEVLKRKIFELNEKIAEHSGGREEFQRQRDAQRAVINALTEKIDALEDERKALSERVLSAQQRSRNLRGQVDTLSRGLQYHSVDEINKRIQDIEYQMMTETMSLKDEKKLIADIEKLKKMKPELAKLAELQEMATSNDPSAANETRDRQQVIRQEIKKLRDLRGDEQEKLRNLMNEREKSTAPLRDLIEERDKLRREQNAHNVAASRLQSELRVKQTEYRAYDAKLQAARYEQDRWEKTLQAVEADKRLILDDLNRLQEGVYDRRSQLAIQMIAYLNEQMRMRVTVEPAAEDTTNESPVANGGEVELADGKFVVHAREKVEPMSRTKKIKKKTSQPKALSDKINHSFSTIEAFVQLGFDKDYPLTVKECPAAIEILERIVEEQRVKNQAQQEANQEKRAHLMARLKEIEVKEKEHLAKQPSKTTKAVKEAIVNA
eukprot:Blabericola_migrator_1__1886@NODE_1512_length_4373_cov_158_589178_g993_i0_p2_GENE_NODE_1512_length_4373_cov_158_589178_g993_i0NODE_1512_length_4373_cov_158_589178_g993_i0_p2_ORF_typecomplete_len480_score104_75KIAA1328/PF15369_6/1_8e04KIAA1328/PF15369_6/0_00094AAA_13/PF13166_6/0_0039AAA_13/PF13166_6/24AAA_13/PF13166_6/9_4e02DUF4472/PF14739_6/0_0073DUF4472/PF14739_6/1_8e04DUF4472/PF14739_6/1_5e03DUF4472/PF14739_6/1_1e03ATG16/PF08614_11/0_056ATG16/PF08614_11/14ATG16/PF08614_11/2_8e02MAD/PF05557_13/